MARSIRLAKERIVTSALLVRRVQLREADDIVHFFTEQAGSLSAIARGARRSSRRFSSLEPMHLLRIRVEVSPSRELGTLTEASLERPRLGLTSQLAAMNAAGQALRWLRKAAPARSPEPQFWEVVNRLLDALDGVGADAAAAEALLAACGLRMLVIDGWRLQLAQCVRCGKPCPSNARAIVDVHAGGVVCRTCGGIGSMMSSRQRAAMMVAFDGGDFGGDAKEAVTLVERALEIHGQGLST